MSESEAQAPAPASAPKRKKSKKRLPFLKRLAQALQRRMLLGVVTVIPITVVIVVFFFSVNKIYGVFAPLIARLLNIDLARNQNFYIDVGVRVVAIFLFVAALYIIGLLSQTFLVRRTIRLGEAIVERIPVLKTLYRGSKQIVETVSMPTQSAFREVVLVEYPRTHTWVVAFVTGELNIRNTGESFINLFVPTTPNPTSGFLLLVPVGDVRATNLSVEEGVKLVMSAGVLAPANMETVPYAERRQLDKHNGAPRDLEED